MFSIKVQGCIDNIVTKMDVKNRLAQRQFVEPAKYTQVRSGSAFVFTLLYALRTSANYIHELNELEINITSLGCYPIIFILLSRCYSQSVQIDESTRCNRFVYRSRDNPNVWLIVHY